MLNEKIYQFSLQDVTSRVAGFILKYVHDNNLIVKAERAESFEMVISKKEMANTIGTIPETLSRTFQKLNKMNVLKVSGKQVVVIDFKKLQELASD